MVEVYNKKFVDSNQMSSQIINNASNLKQQATSSNVFGPNYTVQDNFRTLNLQSMNPSITNTDGNTLKKSQNSASSIGSNQKYATLTYDELYLMVNFSKNRRQEGERLKNLLRSNMWPSKHPMRQYLWKTLLQISNNSSLNNDNKENESVNTEIQYNKYLHQIFGKSKVKEVHKLPDFVNLTSHNGSPPTIGYQASNKQTNNSHLNYYYLNTDGQQAIKRILCVYEYNYPHVTFNPALVSISSLLLHYMQEHEVFAALCAISSTKKHLTESRLSWETNCSVFIRLLKSYCRSSYDMVVKYASDSLESIFSEWYWWIFDSLSFEFLVKVMDCFLLEGQKVLYRISLAIVQQFARYIEYIEDYQYLNELFFDVVKSENIKVNRESISNFCSAYSNAQDSIEKLFKLSFSIRNLKRTTIQDFYAKEESKRKSNQTTTSNKNETTDQTTHTRPPVNSPNKIYLIETTTSILSHENLCTIWDWLPLRLSVYSPKLLFTTQEHGTSLNTLYNILDELEQCLIVLKTFQGEIFGAYCSGNWNERKKKTLYFGNGETFLFSLAPNKCVYKWIGTRVKKEMLSPNQEMFLRADMSKIAIGGGSHDGLSINANLTEGSTNRCDTFENQPLANTIRFEIAILEVITFENS